MEQDTHDKLLIALHKYQEINVIWEKRHSVRSGRATRRWLKHIQRLAKERWREIR
jgi:hypothetical protein